MCFNLKRCKSALLITTKNFIALIVYRNDLYNQKEDLTEEELRNIVIAMIFVLVIEIIAALLTIIIF